MENTVETMDQGIVLDDAVQAPEEPSGESLATIAEEAPGEQPEKQPGGEPRKEPGYVRLRIDQAVAKALKEQEERIRAEYDAKLAPIYESMMDRQARELVEQGEFKSLERAKEYVRMKNGISERPANDTPPAQPTQRVADNDPAIQVRTSILAKQAEKIKANRGLDVMAAFQSDPDIQQRILSGEWDFYDVADAMSQNNRRVPPTPVRSPNGVGGVNAMSVQNMSEEQFKRLQANLASGRKYDMRK